MSDDKAARKELEYEVRKLQDVLRRNGFEPCNSAACNCNSWHHVGGFAARFREIDDATTRFQRNGETLLSRIERIAAEAEALYEALDALTKALVWQCPAVDNYLTISSSRFAFEAKLSRIIEHARAVLRRVEDATDTT